MQEGYESSAKATGEAQRMSIGEAADDLFNSGHSRVCDARIEVIGSQRVKGGHRQLDVAGILRRGIAECCRKRHLAGHG